MLGVEPTWPGYGFPRVQQWQCATPPSWLPWSRVLTANRHAEWTTPHARRPAARREDRARGSGRSGIGRACAIGFGRGRMDDCRLRSSDRALDETLRAAGGDGIAIPTDLTEPARVADLFKRSVEAYGRFDLTSRPIRPRGQSSPVIPRKPTRLVRHRRRCAQATGTSCLEQ